jgi:hypothetical protein
MEQKRKAMSVALVEVQQAIADIEYRLALPHDCAYCLKYNLQEKLESAIAGLQTIEKLANEHD